jgi:hypothetical protein
VGVAGGSVGVAGAALIVGALAANTRTRGWRGLQQRIPYVVVGLSYCTIRSRTRVSSRAAPTPAAVVEFASFGDADPATPALFLHQLTDTWGDLAAVQLNVGHEVFVG